MVTGHLRGSGFQESDEHSREDNYRIIEVWGSRSPRPFWSDPQPSGLCLAQIGAAAHFKFCCLGDQASTDGFDLQIRQIPRAAFQLSDGVSMERKNSTVKSP